MPSSLRGNLLVAGTGSDVGKTAITTGLCRLLARRGVHVAPFKAQNMSNNSMVTPDGAEIGRAQWVQAVAAGTTPEAAMNPVLLKPGSDLRSHVVVMGRSSGVLDASSFPSGRGALAEAAFAAYDDLSARYDVVICEGAGSPAEINLRQHDFVNMGLARRAEMPTVVVGDIDRGGVFAALFGTLALLDAADQRLVAGFVVNKFRGDAGLLRPGTRTLERLTSRPVLGVIPWQPDLWLDSEDALAAYERGGVAGRGDAPRLRVAVVVLPRISNHTDIDALCLEPALDVFFTANPRSLASADLVVLPGTRATVADLTWLRGQGLADAVAAHARSGGAVLGICGGFQMLGREIVDHDGVEGEAGASVEGLGLLDVRTRFRRDKTVRLVHGTAWGHPVEGYEIHHGHVDAGGGDPFLEGVRVGNVFGTLWHGTLENDGFRHRFLEHVACVSGGEAVDLGDVSFAEARERRIDALADALEQHLDLDSLLDLIDGGADLDLPVVSGGLVQA